NVPGRGAEGPRTRMGSRPPQGGFGPKSRRASRGREVPGPAGPGARTPGYFRPGSCGRAWWVPPPGPWPPARPARPSPGPAACSPTGKAQPLPDFPAAFVRPRQHSSRAPILPSRGNQIPSHGTPCGFKGDIAEHGSAWPTNRYFKLAFVKIKCRLDTYRRFCYNTYGGLTKHFFGEGFHAMSQQWIGGGGRPFLRWYLHRDPSVL